MNYDELEIALKKENEKMKRRMVNCLNAVTMMKSAKNEYVKSGLTNFAKATGDMIKKTEEIIGFYKTLIR